MSAVNWLDVLLVVLGLLAVSPRLWMGFRRRRAVCLPPLGCTRRTGTLLLFYLGLCFLTMAGVDVGMAAWDNRHRVNNDEAAIVLAEFLAANPQPDAIKPEAPDFCLPVLDEGRSVRLSDFRGHKPVVLIFGSFG